MKASLDPEFKNTINKIKINDSKNDYHKLK